MDGADFCRAIRTFDRDTPIVVFSGEARTNKIQAAKEAGADIYITKPADFEQVANPVISLILESQRNERESLGG